MGAGRLAFPPAVTPHISSFPAALAVKDRNMPFEIYTCGAFYFGLFIFLVALTYAPRSYITPHASAFEV